MGEVLSAATISGGTVLYLEPSALVWGQTSGAWYAAYFFNGSKNAWAKMSAVKDKSGYYTVTAPSGSWSNVIFCQMKPGTSTCDWNNKLAQTADLVYETGYDLFTVFDSNAKCDGKNDSGAWSQMDTGSGEDPYAPVVPEYPESTVTKCPGESVTLTSSKADKNYIFKWSTGETTTSIQTTVEESAKIVTCTVTKLGRPTLSNNLIENGGFEDISASCPYNGFASVYECYGVDKPFEYGKSYRGFYKESSKNTFYNVKPVNGSYMLECDGDYNKKSAWIAKTAKNPKLKIEKGKKYQFSYKAANGDKIYRSVLIFSIKYNGKTEQLVPARILPADTKWYSYGDGNYWTAPEDCSDVELFLEDNCHTDKGNDFFLDDIMFQPLNESTDLVAEETFNIVPKDCKPTEIEACEDDVVTLEAKETGTDYFYEWSTGETTKSIDVIAVLGKRTYTCKITKTGKPSLDKNIIVNGGFEDVSSQCPYNGFTSDYECYKVNEPFDYGKTYRGFMKISQGESWGIRAASGKGMLECDGDLNEKAAWIANTSKNPDLKIKAGVKYQFSYKAAMLGTKNAPILTFYIAYNGIKEKLVPTQTLVAGAGWTTYGEGIYWTAPADCNNVTLSLVDNCPKNDGNDYALDDIMFQPLTAGTEVVGVETFNVTGKDCKIPTQTVEVTINVTPLVINVYEDEVERGSDYDKYGFHLKNVQKDTVCVRQVDCNRDTLKLKVTEPPVPPIPTQTKYVTIVVLPDNGETYYGRVNYGEDYKEHGFTVIQPQQDTICYREEGCSKYTLYLTVVRVIEIPKFFTPNADGLNDTWEIKGIGNYPSSQIEIYDRYGRRVALYYGSDRGWDGTYNGHPMPSTDYWYTIRVFELLKTYSGHFTLKRQ